MDITWSPIQVPTKPRKQFGRANWPLYEDMLKNIAAIEVKTGDNIDTIDQALSDIQTAIQQADQACIPTTTYQTLPHPAYTVSEKRLIHRLKLLNELMVNQTATPQDWYQLKQIQQQLNQACKRNIRQLWNLKIQKTQNTTDPKQFWHQIKILQGNFTQQKRQVIHNANREEIYEPEAQECLFREFWEKIYQETRTQDEPKQSLRHNGRSERQFKKHRSCYRKCC